MTNTIITIGGIIFTGYLSILLSVTPFYKFLPSSAKRYIKNNWISLDQWLNTITFGVPDETISSRAYKHVLTKGRDTKFNYYLLRVLEFIDPDHGEKSVEWDEGDLQK